MMPRRHCSHTVLLEVTTPCITTHACDSASFASVVSLPLLHCSQASLSLSHGPHDGGSHSSSAAAASPAAGCCASSAPARQRAGHEAAAGSSPSDASSSPYGSSNSNTSKVKSITAMALCISKSISQRWPRAAAAEVLLLAAAAAGLWAPAEAPPRLWVVGVVTSNESAERYGW